MAAAALAKDVAKVSPRFDASTHGDLAAATALHSSTALDLVSQSDIKRKVDYCDLKP